MELLKFLYGTITSVLVGVLAWLCLLWISSLQMFLANMYFLFICIIVLGLVLGMTYCTRKNYLQKSKRVLILFLPVSFILNCVLLFFWRGLWDIFLPIDEVEDPHRLGVSVWAVVFYFPSVLLWGIYFDIVKNTIKPKARLSTDKSAL